MPECSFIDYRLQNRGVVVLTLDNPPLNLTTLVTLDKLLSACHDIACDERVRAVVVTGSGSKAFCAGSDISEFVHVRDDVVSRKLARENMAFTALEQLPMPVIAALNGVALGGGAEIALACDIRIMDETARIGFPEVKLGIFPGSGGIFRLPRLVGPAKAYELLYTGEPIDAHEAHRIGLINRLAPAGQALSAAVALAESLANRRQDRRRCRQIRFPENRRPLPRQDVGRSRSACDQDQGFDPRNRLNWARKSEVLIARGRPLPGLLSALNDHDRRRTLSA